MPYKTVDGRTVDSAGAFLISQLEAYDPKLNEPLYNYEWSRDIDIRRDVGLGHEYTSFSTVSYGFAPGAGGSNINWVSPISNAIPTVTLNSQKLTLPLNPWAAEANWSDFELESAGLMGTQLDQAKLNGIRIKWNMDVDQMVYIGDPTLTFNAVTGIGGLFNSSAVTNVANAVTGNWATATPAQILADLTEIQTSVQQTTGFSRLATRIILDPISYARLASVMLNTGTSVSIGTFAKQNNILTLNNGLQLEILSSKWLDTAGVGSTRRMVAYIKDYDYVRFPMTDLNRAGELQRRGIHTIADYIGKLGCVEMPYPETIAYRDGL